MFKLENKMDRFKLVVTVPIAEKELDDNLNTFLSRSNYDKHVLLTGLVPPDKREIHFRNITEFQVELLKTWFRGNYRTSEKRDSCSFSVLSETGYVV